MKNIWFVLPLLLAPAAHAEYRNVPVVNALPNASVELTKAELVDAKVYTEVKGAYENQMLKVTVGLDFVSWGNAPVTGVEWVSAQRSVDYELNPTDVYYRIARGASSGISVGGSRQQVSFDTTYFLQQRPVENAGKAWPPFKPAMLEPAKRFVNIDAGMLGGLERWSLYELDFTDPASVKLNFKKTYSYVQGQVLDH